MKLLIISPYFYEPHRWMISGYKTAMELSKQIPVAVLTTGETPFEKLNKNLHIYRVKDWFLPDPINFSVIPGLFGQIKRVIAHEQPDCFLVNKNMFYSSLAIIYLRLTGRKVLTQVDTFPGINWFSRNRYVNGVLWVYARSIGILLLKLSTKVILLHEGLIPVASRYKLTYTVIHNGVDWEKIQKITPAALPGAKKSSIKIGYFGRLESVKGYTDILAVAKTLTQRDARLIFYLVGNSVGKEAIVKEFATSQIRFLGHRQDFLPLMKAMDIFILASYSEGLPNALMEAMACGVAPVASNVGGVKVLIKNNVTGLLFEPGNTDQMRKQLQKLIDSPQLRQKIGQAGQRVIEKDFNWKNIAAQLINELKITAQ